MKDSSTLLINISLFVGWVLATIFAEPLKRFGSWMTDKISMSIKSEKARKWFKETFTYEAVTLILLSVMLACLCSLTVLICLSDEFPLHKVTVVVLSANVSFAIMIYAALVEAQQAYRLERFYQSHPDLRSASVNETKTEVLLSSVNQANENLNPTPAKPPKIGKRVKSL